MNGHLKSVRSALAKIPDSEILRAARVLKTAPRVYIVGNGGSAATASHFSNDLTKMCHIPAFNLSDLTSAIMAYGNDNGWDQMFAALLDVWMNPGEVLVAISCSGRSKNVIEAVRKAHTRKNRVVIMSGNRSGNFLSRYQSSAAFYVEHDEITVQEDVHMAICHAIARQIASGGKKG